MDLIIVDQNINYSKSLREYCLESANFKNVVIYRNLEELLDSYLPKKGIILFEHNVENTKTLDKFQTENHDLTLVALSEANDALTNSELLYKGVASIISKSEKLEIILEEIKMIIKGKRILPKVVFDKMKQNETITKLSRIQKINKKHCFLYLQGMVSLS